MRSYFISLQTVDPTFEALILLFWILTVLGKNVLFVFIKKLLGAYQLFRCFKLFKELKLHLLY